MSTALVVLVTSAVIYVGLVIIYNVFFHPISRFPGPRLWAISRIPYVLTFVRGDLTQRTHEFHQRYGPIVRLAPNELSFIDGQAWQDIYNHHQGQPNFPKNPVWMAPGDNCIHSILSANDADHARYRRLLSHAFSERALRHQEYLIQSYIDLLIHRLQDCASLPETAIVDIAKWLNFTTFDIVGDLSLGESFHCLDEGSYHGWVSILFTQFMASALFVSLRLLGLGKSLRILLPRAVLKNRREHANAANERVRRRLNQASSADSQKNDFMTYILRRNDEKGMSVPEIEATMRVVVVAGSETTATALSGIIGNLLRNREAMGTVLKEIRHSFRHSSEICAERVTKLAYLGAVIEEGLRFCSPVPTGMPRVVPGNGAKISGQWVPGGTFVSASGFASNRSSLNFPNSPSKFDPSRWLSDSPLPKSSYTASVSAFPSAFNPFSLGPRNCLGRNLAYLEMRLILTHLLFSFDIEADGPSNSWDERKTWILWEKNPLNVRLTRRDWDR